MKNIKFRAKSLDKSKWTYGYLAEIESNWDYYNGYGLPTEYSKAIISTEYTTREIININPETIGQYINYRDINNNELYTNDIIYYHRHEGSYSESKAVYKLGVVLWDDRALGFRMFPIDTHNYKVNSSVDGEKIRTSHRIIRVGNIFDDDVKTLVDKYLKVA